MWTSIEDQKVGELILPADLTAVKTNLDFLAQPPLNYYARGATDGDYSTTQVQFLIPIDAVNMNLGITTTGGILIAVLSTTWFQSSTNFIGIGFAVDNAQVFYNGVVARYYDNRAGTTVATADSVTVIMPIARVEPGAHFIQPLWASSGAQTLTIIDDYRPFFGVWEV